MRVLFAAREGFSYNRVRILLAGLEAIAPDQVEVWQFAKRNKEWGVKLAAKASGFDLIYVPPFRRLDVGFIKKYVPHLPVLFDPLIGTTITRVVDDGYWWRGPYARWRDHRDFMRADALLFDTDAHRNWSVKTLSLTGKPVYTLPIGAELPELINRSKKVGEQFKVGFYGSLAPLQGIEVILQAAELLNHREDIRFEIIGPVDRKKETAKLKADMTTRQVDYYDVLPYEELLQRVSEFDLALGIFGQSLKADVVVPNKIYHYAAAGLPFITRQTVGMQEVFTAQHAYTGIAPSAEVLAKAIVEHVTDAGLRQNLGATARSFMAGNLSPRHIAELFLGICEEVVTAFKK